MVYYRLSLYVKVGNSLDNVTLIGMPGSGKSTVGVLLAKLLGYQFLDVDLLIQEREGALLQEILDQRGTPAFLDAEERAVALLRDLECPVVLDADGINAAAAHIDVLEGRRSPTVVTPHEAEFLRLE